MMRTSAIVLMFGLTACSHRDEPEPFKLKIYSSGPDRRSDQGQEIISGSEDEPETCAVARNLTYGPTVVELTGKVLDKKYYGPPNYGETPNEDIVEDVLILMVDEPFSLSESRTGPSDDEQACVDRAQLVITDADYPKAGEHVTLKGTLFGQWSGRHRTKVLLSVDSSGNQSKS